jgi:hypothetical protein
MPVGGDEPETLDFGCGPNTYQPRLRAIRLSVIERGLRSYRERRSVRPFLRRAARSLLVTPWFAAGGGIVLAAGLWIYSPHTELKFPASAVNPAEVPCAPPGCGPGPGGHANGQPAASKRGMRMPHRHAAAAGGQNLAVSDLRFRFTILWQRSGMFGAFVSVSGPNLPSSWRLTFQLPGARIGHVIGALWQPAAGGSGGTAYSGTAGTPNGQAVPSNGQQSAKPGTITFLVLGTGSPGTPTGCMFNRASCTFG